MSPTTARPRPVLAAGLGATLLLATLGEGGGSAIGLALWHSAIVACGVGVLLFHRPALSPGVRFGAPTVVWAPLAVFALLALAGALRAPYAYAAWLVVLELGIGLLAFALAARCGTGLIERLAWPLRAAAATHGTFLVIQRVATDELRPASSFLNPNHAGAWLVVATLVGLGAWPETRRERLLAGASAAAAAAGLLVVGSRGAFLALACGLAVLAASLWSRLGPRARRAALAGGLVTVVALGAAWAMRSRQADPFRYQRLRIWTASAAIVADHPVWGTGPGQLRVAALRYQFPDDDGLLRHDRRFAVTHSDVLRVPAEFGLPAALVALVAGFAAAAGVARRRARGELPVAAGGAVAALSAILAQATVDNPTRWSSVTLCAAVLAGALVSRRSDAPNGALHASVALRTTAALAICVLLVVADLAPTAGVIWHGPVPRGRLDAGQLDRVRLAARVNRLHPEPWRRLAEHELAAPGGLDLAGYARAREAAEAALRRQPADPAYHRTLARVEAQACRTLVLDERTRDRAQRAYLRAAELAPTDAVAWLELAVLWLDTGEPERAADAARTALALEPRAIVPRLALADALLRDEAAPSRARAIELVDEARELWPVAAIEARSGSYAEALLVPDPRVAARLAATLEQSDVPTEP